MKTIVSMLVFLALASVVSAQVVYESKEECLARPDGPTYVPTTTASKPLAAGRGGMGAPSGFVLIEGPEES